MWQAVSTLIIAAAGLYISWQQKRIADVRLRHDMYDRQFKVYAAAKALLVTFQFEGKISQEDYFKFLGGIADADFIFGKKDVAEYLETLRGRTVELILSTEAGASGSG